MTKDEFLAAPVECWFSSARNELDPEWFAAVWRADPTFRDELTHETKRYIRKAGVLADPELLAMLGRALTREEVLALAEELRQDARHRILEWGAQFEKAFAPLGIVLSVSAEELASVGVCLFSAVQDRNLDQVRFLTRGMRAAGVPPEQAVIKQFTCDLPAHQIATMPHDQFERLPFRWLPVVEYAEQLGLREIAEIIRSGGRAGAESSPPADSPFA
jgi:hypothetical protein